MEGVRLKQMHLQPDQPHVAPGNRVTFRNWYKNSKNKQILTILQTAWLSDIIICYSDGTIKGRRESNVIKYTMTPNHQCFKKKVVQM
jgi:hypothetical protein